MAAEWPIWTKRLWGTRRIWWTRGKPVAWWRSWGEPKVVQVQADPTVAMDKEVLMAPVHRHRRLPDPEDTKTGVNLSTLSWLA